MFIIIFVYIYLFSRFLIDCLNNANCAPGASCNAGVCSCNAGTPVLVGDSASDTTDECVECTATNFGSCHAYDSCDTANNVCVGIVLFLFDIIFIYFDIIFIYSYIHACISKTRLFG